MQYIWEHRLWGDTTLTTNDGRTIRVIDQGVRNTDAGPDFFNAKIEIDGCMWAGNVEIHYRASDWFRHHHDTDAAYDSVILHVVDKDDAPVTRPDGQPIPQVVMPCTADVYDRYSALVSAHTELPCAAAIASLTPLETAEWIQTLAFERLADKSNRIHALLEQCHGSWEDVCYVTFARTLGFGTNSDPFERLAKSLPLRMLQKHADSQLQLEALFFGQAGLLATAETDFYTQRLRAEYAFLATKFSLRQPADMGWKALRMRPQNFPWRRVALLASYVKDGFRLMTDILEAEGDIDRLRSLFTVSLTGYWANHYTFGRTAPVAGNALSRGSVNIVLINTVAPLYYAYASATDCYDWAERAVSLLEKLRAEQNHITEMFTRASLKVDNALTSQAVVQLRNAYCLQRKCLYCVVGHKMLSQRAVSRPGAGQ